VSDSLILIGFVASLCAGLATGVGALPALLVPRISPRLQDTLLGFAAGVMLAASFFSLIVPGLEAAERDYGGEVGAAAIVAAGLMLGALALWLINEYVPHEHFIFGHEGPVSASLRRIWLFVIAIALHNFPEGLAVGAMLFVISDEIIPETHRKGFETEGTFGLMVGFVVMMMLDVTLA
jgi:zinc transporter, ZIP family